MKHHRSGESAARRLKTLRDEISESEIVDQDGLDVVYWHQLSRDNQNFAGDDSEGKGRRSSGGVNVGIEQSSSSSSTAGKKEEINEDEATVIGRRTSDFSDAERVKNGGNGQSSSSSTEGKQEEINRVEVAVVGRRTPNSSDAKRVKNVGIEQSTSFSTAGKQKAVINQFEVAVVGRSLPNFSDAGRSNNVELEQSSSSSYTSRNEEETVEMAVIGRISANSSHSRRGKNVDVGISSGEFSRTNSSDFDIMEALFGTIAKNHRKKPMIDSGERRKSDATASPNRPPVMTQRKSDTAVDLQILLPLPPPPGSPWRAAAAASVSVSPNSPLVGAGTSSRKLQANAKMTNGLSSENSRILMGEKREIGLSEKSPEREEPKKVDRNRTISRDSIGSEFDMMEALFGTLTINRRNSPVAAKRPQPPPPTIPTTTPPPVAQLPSAVRSPPPALPAITIGSSACEAKLSLTVPPPPPPPRNLSAECADLPLMEVSSSTSSSPPPNENKSDAASPPSTNNCDECADLPEEVSSSTSSSPSTIEITTTAAPPQSPQPAKQSTSSSITTKLPPMVKRGAGLVREAPPPPPLNMPLPRSPGQRKSRAVFSKAENATPEKKPETEEAELTKLKPLLWDKVPTRANHSMVWDAIGDGSPHFDYQLMESLFGTIATNRKKLPSPPAAEDVRNRSPAQTFLLDQRKSQNISIVLRSIGITRENVVDYLLNPKSTAPPLDTLEKLNGIAPSDAEQDLIRSYPTGSTSHLAETESFLHHLLSAVPDAFRRIDSLVFRSHYESEIQTLCQNLKTLDEACKELKKGGLFIKILEVILKVGNAMNSGTALGNAKAFNLASLRRISEVKSTDGKTTLLHFVVQEVVRREGRRRSLYQDPHPRIATAGDEEREYIMLGLPILSGLSSEFSNVKAAAGIRYDSVVGCCESLRGRESRTREFVGGVEEGEFREEMEVFSEAAEKEMKEMEEEVKRVVETVKRTTAYYHAGSKNRAGLNRFEVFVIVKDFLGMVDGVCVVLEKSTRSEIKESRSLESYMRMPTMRFSLKNSVSASSSTTDSDEDF